MLAALAMAGAAGLGASRVTNDRVVSRIALRHPAADLAALSAQGFEILAVDPDENWVDVMARASRGGSSARSLGREILEEQVLDSSYGPDSGYHTPDEVEAELATFEARFPDLVTRQSIGKTGEGRDIWAVRLTSSSPSSAHSGEGSAYVDMISKPAVLFNAMHHAREVMSTEVALDTIEQLVTGYGHDEKITRWLDEIDIWVLPMLNPDGNAKVWSTDSMWRKNATGGYGVDVNRNYPYKWGTCRGSSGDRRDDDYRGPSAASEAETKAMMAFATMVRPVVSISYHSYGEIVIFPYGCQGVRTPASDVTVKIGHELAALIPRDGGGGNYRPGTAWELLYAVDGGDIDWLHHELGVLPFVIELNDGLGAGGFQPAYRQRDPTVKKLRPAWGHLLDRMLGAGIRGVVTDANGAARQGLTVKVRLEEDAESSAVSFVTRSDGSFHALLEPGRYVVTTQNAERRVTVLATRRNLSIRLP